MSGAGKTILVAAGGTGGHLFPAFALAEELMRRSFTVDLVTDMRGDRYGTGFPARDVHRIPSATLGGRSPVQIMKTGVTLSRGIAAATKLLKRIEPAAVVGFGGYPTFPPLLAASFKSIPTALHEQNAVLGRANRMLAKRVSAIALSFAETKYLDSGLQDKARVTGNPVRDMVVAIADTPYQAPQPGAPFKVLIFGGSQGAKFFSDTAPAALATIPAAVRHRLVVTQQCREEDLDRVRALYAESGITAELATFFTDLPQRIADSHLVVGRAGASSIAELTVLGRPSILVPLPHALDNDQLNNARQLAESGGAWCIEQKVLSVERMAEEIYRLAEAPTELAEAAANAKRLGRPQAVVALADLIEEIAVGA